MAHETQSATDTHEHHVTEPIVYVKVYGLLMIGMFLTVIFASKNLGPFNNAVAMVIAITKATLVVLFFMQVKYGTRLVWLWAGLGFVWFTLLSIILQDYMTRGWVLVQGW
jgi:cytochrome c oxidase subunit 4